MKATLARIERFNGAVNAYCHLDPDGALAAARASETRWMAGAPKGLADGVPVGVKDNIAVAGMPSRFGSRLTSADPLTFDAPAVARLKEHGAVVLGKTAMPEYGWKATSDSPLTGFTRNPWDTRMTTGGSSAGAVAATVLGMGAIHLGTDGGGSIRIPAAFTGVLRPQADAGARAVRFRRRRSARIAHHGPLTRTVADAALAMSVIAAPDVRDVYGWISPRSGLRSGLDDGVRGLRIAYSPRLGFARRVHPEIESAVAAAVEDLREPRRQRRGGRPGPRRRSRSTPGTPSGGRPCTTSLQAFGDRWRELADPALLVAADRERSRSPCSITIRAQLERAHLHNVMAKFHETYDLLLTPCAAAAGLRGRRSRADARASGARRGATGRPSATPSTSPRSRRHRFPAG